VLQLTLKNRPLIRQLVAQRLMLNFQHYQANQTTLVWSLVPGTGDDISVSTGVAGDDHSNNVAT
jgi:hypothetical protein